MFSGSHSENLLSTGCLDIGFHPFIAGCEGARNGLPWPWAEEQVGDMLHAPVKAMLAGEFNPVTLAFSPSPTFKPHQTWRDLHIINTLVNVRNGLVRLATVPVCPSHTAEAGPLSGGPWGCSPGTLGCRGVVRGWTEGRSYGSPRPSSSSGEKPACPGGLPKPAFGLLQRSLPALDCGTRPHKGLTLTAKSITIR